MKLRNFAATVAVVGGLALSTGAQAAVIVDGGVGGHLTYKLHNTGDDTAPNVTTDVPAQGFLVDLTEQSTPIPKNLNQSGDGDGHAVINGEPYFYELLIDPTNFAGFDAFQFNLDFQQKAPNPGNGGPEVNIDYGSFLLSWTLVGGGTGSQTVLIENGNSKYRIFGNDDEVFETLTLSDLAGTIDYETGGGRDGPRQEFNDVPYAAGFNTIRQMSFNYVPDPCVTNPTAPGCGGPGTGVVPEPGTWALMILGFGGAGAMLRRRRTAIAA